jgi:hypothetical protein
MKRLGRWWVLGAVMASGIALAQGPDAASGLVETACDVSPRGACPGSAGTQDGKNSSHSSRPGCPGTSRPADRPGHRGHGLSTARHP